MLKNWTIALTLLLLMIIAWGLFTETDNLIIILNGQQLHEPFNGMVSVGGFIVAIVALFCMAILFVFILSGIWLIIIGGFLLMSLIFTVLFFPFSLPLLAPLVIVWIFIAMTKRLKHH